MADIRILLVDDEPDISATALTQATETGFYDVQRKQHEFLACSILGELGNA